MKKCFGGRFILRETPNDHEYLYDRQEQILLAGGRFYSMRRRPKQADAGARGDNPQTVPWGDEGRLWRSWGVEAQAPP